MGPTTRAPVPSSPNDGFRAFIDRDWERWLDECPEIATVIGTPGRDDRWTDDSPQGIEARRRHLLQSQEELATFNESSMSPADRLNWAIYRDLLGTAVQGLDFGLDPLPFRFGTPRVLWMPINQVDGIHASSADILRMQPRARTEDYRAIVARLRRLPDAVQQTIGLLKEGLSRGWVQPKAPLRSLPAQIRGLIPREPRSSELFRPFVEVPSTVEPGSLTGLFEEACRAYTSGIVPAFEQLGDFLEGTYLPQCRDAVGASSLPGGPDWYRYLVAWETTTHLAPQAIHDIGTSEIRRLRGEMEKVKAEAGFSGTLDEFAELLRTDPKFVHPSPQVMLERYRALAKRIDPELMHQFGRLPRLPYGIAAVPDYRAPSSPAAYYWGGATATGRAGCFYVNTYDLAARPSWEMEPLTLHESVPGHHLQLALSEELEGLPEFRRHSGYTAFVEGWGLYAEGLGEALGLYTDPYAKFGRLSMDAWRSARLVVDTGMHALGWTREQAIEYLRANTGKSMTDIVAEVDRYIVWPGQALAYKVGQLKLSELRHRAETQLGARFDVRRFHDVVLADGGLSLTLLEERFTAWLSAAAKAS